MMSDGKQQKCGQISSGDGDVLVGDLGNDRHTKSQQANARDKDVSADCAHHGRPGNATQTPLLLSHAFTFLLASGCPASDKPGAPKDSPERSRDADGNPKEQLVAPMRWNVGAQRHIDASELIRVGIGGVDDADVGSKRGERVEGIEWNGEIERDWAGGDSARGGIVCGERRRRAGVK